MKTVTILLVIVAISCIGLLVFLSILYMHTMPETPQMEAKRVYPFNVHGSIVYLTKGQELLLKLLFWGGGLTGMGAGILNLIKRNVRK
jgi:hypothetical protein